MLKRVQKRSSRPQKRVIFNVFLSQNTKNFICEAAPGGMFPRQLQTVRPSSILVLAPPEKTKSWKGHFGPPKSRFENLIFCVIKQRYDNFEKMVIKSWFYVENKKISVFAFCYAKQKWKSTISMPLFCGCCCMLLVLFLYFFSKVCYRSLELCLFVEWTWFKTLSWEKKTSCLAISELRLLK